ncbi:MAG: hypothetical protein RIR18_1592, partial [Pseudomonadota bacterium]
MRLTIKAKLALAFTVVILLSAISTWMAISGLGQLNDSIHSLVDISARRDKLTVQLQRTIFLIQREEKNFLLANELADIDKFDKGMLDRREEFRLLLNEFRSVMPREEEQAKVAKVEEMFGQLVKAQDKVRDVGRIRSNSKALAIIQRDLKPLQANVTSDLRKLIKKQAGKTSPNQGQLNEKVSNLLNVWSNARSALSESTMTSDDAETEGAVLTYFEAMSRVDSLLADLRNSTSGDDAKILDIARTQISQWKNLAENAVAFTRQNTEVKANALSVGEVRAAATKLSELLNQVSEEAKQGMADDKLAADDQYGTVRIAMISAAVISL